MEESRKCPLCGGSAQRTKPDKDLSVYEWKCEGCGTWRAGFSREQVIYRLSEHERSVLANQVRKAKADDQILRL
jgi:hypothetical protein